MTTPNANDPGPLPEVLLTASPVIQSVNDLLTSGLIVACYYDSQPDQVSRPDCFGLASVAYGRIALCRSCDQRRSAVGRGTARRVLADPESLLEVIAARDRLTEAEAALAAAVARARASGHSWSALGAVLELTRQGAQQRFARATERT